MREIILAVVLAVTALLTVVILAKMFDLDKGLAAGVAAGGLTQSAIIGTAGDAITKLGLAADEVARLQGNVAVGYAVTYVFGSFGAIIVCVNILPKLMGRTIREDAIKDGNGAAGGRCSAGPGQTPAAPDLIGASTTWPRCRAFRRGDRKRHPNTAITIERVKRNGQIIDVSTDGAAADEIVLWWAGAKPCSASLPSWARNLLAVEGMGTGDAAPRHGADQQGLTQQDGGANPQRDGAGVRHGIFACS